MNDKKTEQKYFPEYSKHRFADQDLLDVWVKELAVKKIYFKDNGQDLMACWIDKGGEILICEIPSQGFIWNGKIIDLGRLKVGENLGFLNIEKQCTDIMDFVVERIEDL